MVDFGLIACQISNELDSRGATTQKMLWMYPRVAETLRQKNGAYQRAIFKENRDNTNRMITPANTKRNISRRMKSSSPLFVGVRNSHNAKVIEIFCSKLPYARFHCLKETRKSRICALGENLTILSNTYLQQKTRNKDQFP